MKAYQFIYFNSWSGSNSFIWDTYNSEWILDIKADMAEFWKYSVPSDCMIHECFRAKRKFDFENCKCDGNGIQKATFEPILENE
jgi:hypothetical protein